MATLVSVFEKINKQDRGARVKDQMRKNNSRVLRTLLRMNFDDNIKFKLAPGIPSMFYEKDEIHFEFAKKEKQIDAIEPILQLFVDITKEKNVPKREALFLKALKNLTQNEAELIVACKDKKLQELYPKFKKEWVEAEFPQLVS